MSIKLIRSIMHCLVFCN